MSKTQTKKYNNYISGEWVKSSSGEWFDNVNPADTTDIVGRFPASNTDDVNAAVDAAKNAATRWRRTPAPKRAEILFTLGEILRKNKDAFTQQMTREMGKVAKRSGRRCAGSDRLHVLHGWRRPSFARLYDAGRDAE